MFISRLFSLRVVLAIIATILLANAAYAFAAANTVAESGAGEGSATISGYNITAVKYTLATGNPSTVTAVEFNVTPLGAQGAPTNVQARVADPPTDGYRACTNPAGNTWSCTIAPAVNATAANKLSVLAWQQ